MTRTVSDAVPGVNQKTLPCLGKNACGPPQAALRSLIDTQADEVIMPLHPVILAYWPWLLIAAAALVVTYWMERTDA